MNLPSVATVSESVAWLDELTADNWTLARVIDSGVMPWVWLDYAPGYPEIFGDRIEGFLAPMCFNGDTRRLMACDDVLLTWTQLPDGRHVRPSPGLRTDLASLRFKREDIERLADVKPRRDLVRAVPASIEPEDRPEELDAAEQVHRAVEVNGWGENTGQTIKNRNMAWLREHMPKLSVEAVKRIATVANSDKRPGRKPKQRE